ncbi:hypothetical protein D3C85_1913490 [compost metagenome]
MNIEDSRPNAISNIIITNSTGQIVTPNTYSTISSSLIQLNVANLQPGIYFITMNIKITGATRPYSYKTKFIKQ